MNIETDVGARESAFSSRYLVLEVPESVAWCIWRILNDTCEINGGSLHGWRHEKQVNGEATQN